jgi:hypothetical protein
MSDEGPDKPEGEAKPTTNALAFLGPNIMISPVTRPLGAPEAPASEADVERMGGPHPAHHRSLLDRLLGRHPDAPAT